MLLLLLSSFKGKKKKKKKDDDDDEEDGMQQVPRLYLLYKGTEYTCTFSSSSLLSNMHIPDVNMSRLPHLPAACLLISGQGNVCQRQLWSIRPVCSAVLQPLQLPIQSGKGERVPYVGPDHPHQPYQDIWRAFRHLGVTAAHHYTVL